MRPIFHPKLVNGATGDPTLFVDNLFEHRALLFDLGDIQSLSPRKLLRLSHVFVTHAHMDHFIGFDWLLRILLGREKKLQLYGPLGFLEQVEHKLRAYTWNLVHNYLFDFTLLVTEVDGNGLGRCATFRCKNQFRIENILNICFKDNLLVSEPAIQVRYGLLDHGGIDCLGYALEEQVHVNVWKNRLKDLGVPVGAWLRDLKQAVLRDEPEHYQIRIAWQDDGGEQVRFLPLEVLKQALKVVPGQKIAYVTDVAWSKDNISRIMALVHHADVLFIEAAFLDRDSKHGKRKYHLTARQAGEIARVAHVSNVIPMHISPRYQGADIDLLRAEVAAEFGGKVF